MSSKLISAPFLSLCTLSQYFDDNLLRRFAANILSYLYKYCPIFPPCRVCPHWPRLAQTTLYRIKERRKTRWWKSGSLHDALCHLEELICITVICVAVTWFGRGKFDPIILMRTESHLSQRKIYSTFEYSTKYQNFDFILVDNINYYMKIV